MEFPAVNPAFNPDAGFGPITGNINPPRQRVPKPAMPGPVRVDPNVVHSQDAARHIAESDPTFGTDLKAPGAKADAGKLRPTLIFRDMGDALVAVIKIGTDGANKYSDGGWLVVPNGADRYEDADLRHMLKRFNGETVDSDSLGLHLAHEAWNALAKLQLFLNANPEHKVKL